MRRPFLALQRNPSDILPCSERNCIIGIDGGNFLQQVPHGLLVHAQHCHYFSPPELMWLITRWFLLSDHFPRVTYRIDFGCRGCILFGMQEILGVFPSHLLHTVLLTASDTDYTLPDRPNISKYHCDCTFSRAIRAWSSYTWTVNEVLIRWTIKSCRIDLNWSQMYA